MAPKKSAAMQSLAALMKLSSSGSLPTNTSGDNPLQNKLGGLFNKKQTLKKKSEEEDEEESG